MAFLIAAPDMLSLAATEVAGIGESVSAAHAVAASSTTAVVAAAGDEVSTAIAGLFSRHAQQFAALAAQAVGFHDQFVQALTAAGGGRMRAPRRPTCRRCKPWKTTCWR